MGPAITTHRLSKIYYPSRGWRRREQTSPITAVDQVDLSISQGELFGLIGPNGAGKTTLVKMLCTLVLPSSGTATIGGVGLNNERKIRAATGLVVSDERSFFWRLSVRRNLDFFAALYGLHGSDASARIKTVLKDVDLLDRAQQRFSDLSSGIRQRLAIARALLHKPELLFLDEPTRSLDPNATRMLHELILRLMKQQELTVFLITHDLTEAEKLCDRVAVMHNAKIRQIGSPAELRRHLNPQRNYSISVSPISALQFQQLRDLVPSLNLVQADPTNGVDILEFRVGEDEGVFSSLIDYLRNLGIEVIAVESKLPSLEEVFAHYTDDQQDR